MFNRKIQKAVPARTTPVRSRLALSLALAATAWALTACGQEPVRVPQVPGPGGFPGAAGGACIVPGAPTQIAFSGMNIYVDSANVLGGQIPGSWQQFGTMQVGFGGGGIGGQYSTRPGLVDGQMSMNITAPGMQQPLAFNGMNNQACMFGTCPSNFGMPTNQWGQLPTTQAQVSGVIQLSEATKQDILNAVALGRIPVATGFQPIGGIQPIGGFQPIGGIGGFPQAALPQVCVTGIAINSGRWATHALLYDAKVYLYLNNSQNGYMLYF